MQLVRDQKQLTALAREHGVDHTTIYRWRDQMQAAALEALDGKRQPDRRGSEEVPQGNRR
jgi:transposase-like protein